LGIGKYLRQKGWPLLLLLLLEFERLLRIIPKNAVFSSATAACRPRPSSSRGTEGRVVGAYAVGRGRRRVVVVPRGRGGGSRHVGKHPRQQQRLLLRK
jgi:hypothetical protein